MGIEIKNQYLGTEISKSEFEELCKKNPFWKINEYLCKIEISCRYCKEGTWNDDIIDPRQEIVSITHEAREKIFSWFLNKDLMYKFYENLKILREFCKQGNCREMRKYFNECKRIIKYYLP